MHITINQLPSSLRAALASLGYGRTDISVTSAETFSAIDGGSNGYRSFCAAVNLATGETDVTRGSWGGANMFNPSNHVDLDDTARPIPPGFAIVQGREGGSRPVYATVLVHPSTLAPLLPQATGETLSPFEQWLLDLHCAYNSKGRKDELARACDAAADTVRHDVLKIRPMRAAADKVIAETIVRLGKLGLLKVASNGAVSVTTAGKNARNSRAGTFTGHSSWSKEPHPIVAAITEAAPRWREEASK